MNGGQVAIWFAAAFCAVVGICLVVYGIFFYEEPRLMASEIRDAMSARCEHARSRGVETIEVPVDFLQRLLTEADHLEAKVDTAENDVLAMIDELEQERSRG